MSEPSAPAREATAATGIYVYGVVAAGTPPVLFADARGVDSAQPVELLTHAGLAAVTSRVRLDEFGQDVLEANLHDPAWLEAKVRAHDDVLARAVGQATVVPFRFGAIYENEDHVRALLDERRDLASALARLAGTLELGVTAYVDRERVRAHVAAEHDLGDTEEPSGRAYMQRRQLERDLDAQVASLAEEAAHAAHERLTASAQDARVNPLRPRGDDAREMLLNGAYLVAEPGVDAFRASVAELQQRYDEHGVVFEVTGPWPPYNFAEPAES